MTSCLCDVDFETSTVYTEVKRRARKKHRCTACHGIITPREVYTRITSLFDGSWDSAKRCADCQHMIHEVERAFMEGCGGKWPVYYYAMDESWYSLCECLKPEQWPAARQIVAMQNAVCSARGGNIRWSLPLHMQPNNEEESCPTQSTWHP